MEHDAEIQSLTDPSHDECNKVPGAAFHKLTDVVHSGEKKRDDENHSSGKGRSVSVELKIGISSGVAHCER